MYIDVTDPTDPRLRDYVSLRDSSLRRHLEAKEGVFIAEGAKVIQRALEAGYHPRSFLLSPAQYTALETDVASSDAPVYIASNSLMESLTGFHVHRGALACFDRHTSTTLDDLLGSSRLLLCEDIVEPTNLGTIIRSAAGLGWDGIALSPQCADPLYRRAIKTSMGAVFSMPWVRFDDSLEGLRTLKAAGFTLVALCLSDDAVSLDAFVQTWRKDHDGGCAGLDKLALMLGTEGEGLSEDWLGQADVHVMIPMSAGTDSLNVGAAAAIACWALGRR
jgi:tRNA G18 (ribose-2'-O)-methylase SpoU